MRRSAEGVNSWDQITCPLDALGAEQGGAAQCGYAVGSIVSARGREGRDTVRVVIETTRSVLYRRFKDVRDLTLEIREQVEHFFVSYNELAGKNFKPLKWVGARQAWNAIDVEPGTSR